MRKHMFTATALLVLAPLAAAKAPVAQAAGMRAGSVQTDEGLPTIAEDAQGLEPVYTPGNAVGQYYPGQPAPGYGYGSCGCSSCGCSSCEPAPCCQTPCCEPCCCQCCCCGPTFEVRAAGVVLRRNDPGDVP